MVQITISNKAASELVDLLERAQGCCLVEYSQAFNDFWERLCDSVEGAYED